MGIVTLTSVGYGNVTPITPIGKLFAALVTVVGVYQQLAEQLGVSPEVAEEIVAAAHREADARPRTTCPHCGKAPTPEG